MKKPVYLTAEQVFTLNAKHGWFEHGDAQGDVSKEFAQDVIEMHEQIRAAAPELLEAAEMAYGVMLLMSWEDDPTTIKLKAAIKKAKGE